MLLILVTTINAIQLKVSTDSSFDANNDASLTAMEKSLVSMTFEKYEGSKHPVKELALEEALQNVKKLPKEIRAMLEDEHGSVMPAAKVKEVVANASAHISAHDRARQLRASQEKENARRALINAQTTHGAKLIVDAGQFSEPPDYDPNDPNTMKAYLEKPEYATLDKVRSTLNDLYQETMEEMDIEREDCYDSEITLKMAIHQNTGERVMLAATIAQARGEIASAEAIIEKAKKTLLKLTTQLNKHNAQCKMTLDLANEKKAIIESDYHVAQVVENMTDCDKMAAQAASMPALFQCMVSGGSSHIGLSEEARALAKKFKSKKAFMSFIMAAKASLGIKSTEEPMESWDGTEVPAGNMTQEEFDAAMELPQDGDWMDEIGVAELPKDCKALDGKINLGEKCPILADAVGQMVGEIGDALYAQNTFIESFTLHCQEVRSELESAIDDQTEVLSNAQIARTEATEKLNSAQEALRKRVEEFLGLRSELIEKMKKCNTNLRQLFEEMCGLITIRNELYKMSGVHPYLQDCAVSDWSAEECSVTCGGGTHILTRTVVQEPYFGAACPPLTQEAMCNTDACPIDCVYSSDWSEWSSCSADCGGGERQHTRGIAIQAQFGGQACEATLENEQCNVGTCDADCVLGPWTEWTGCSKMCNSGIKTRLRPVVTEAMGTGGCPDQYESDPAAEFGGHRWESEVCNTHVCINNLACKSKLDFSLVLDGSGSVGSMGWWNTVNFAKKFAKRTYMNYEDGATANVVLFSRNVEIVSKQSDDLDAMITALDGMKFPRSITNTGEAVQVSMNLFGDGGREGVPSVIFVVTDGKPTQKHPLNEAAAEAKRKGHRLFFVGVGNNLNWDDMNGWASYPPSQNVVHVEKYRDFPKKIGELIADLCPVVECSEYIAPSDTKEEDYRGCQSVTVSGRTCQYWTSQTPNAHGYQPHLTKWRWPAGLGQRWRGTGDHNFCRNPDDDSGGIWCWTTDPDYSQGWEYCDPRNTTDIPELL